MTEQTTSFTVDQAVAVQRRLRASLGLPDETFPLDAFVGMISDEIEQMRAAGRGDQAVLDIVEQVTGQRVAPEDLQRFYAAPDARGRG